MRSTLKNLLLACCVSIALVAASKALSADTSSRGVLPEPRQHQKWFFNSYHHYSFEMGVRVSHDAWTSTSIDDFAVSCLLEKDGSKTFRFFVATHTPIHNLGEKVKAYFKVGNKSYKLDARVSDIYVGNVHVIIPNELSEMIEKMRRSRRINVFIPSIGGIGFDRDFSLMGFHQASLNTITACAYGE